MTILDDEKIPPKTPLTLRVSDAPRRGRGTAATDHTQGFARLTVSLSAPSSSDMPVGYKA
ncbi:MAG TPA: hypothetical protein VM142_13545 [Acidimicrobiales bacterium]|nr:hypothetical protein [Acidimicrobiales bacterium]